MKGFPVTDLAHLHRLAREKRAVIHETASHLKKPMPAAWVIHFSGERLYRLLQNGLFVYEKEIKDAKDSKEEGGTSCKGSTDAVQEGQSKET